MGLLIQAELADLPYRATRDTRLAGLIADELNTEMIRRRRAEETAVVHEFRFP